MGNTLYYKDENALLKELKERGISFYQTDKRITIKGSHCYYSENAYSRYNNMQNLFRHKNRCVGKKGGKKKKKEYNYETELPSYDNISYNFDLHKIHNFAVLNNIPCDEFFNNSKLRSIVLYKGSNKYTYTKIGNDGIEDIQTLKEKLQKYNLEFENLASVGSNANKLWRKLDKEIFEKQVPVYGKYNQFYLEEAMKNAIPFSYIGAKINKEYNCDGIQLDKNSSYPSIYYSGLYPTGRLFEAYPTHFPEHFQKQFNEQECGIFDIDIEAELKEDKIPCIADKDKSFGRTYLTSYINKKNFICSSIKLKTIIINYNIKNLVLNKVFYWEGITRGIAKNFIDELYAIKVVETGDMKKYIKLLLNSLNGSFSMNRDNFEVVSLNKEQAKLKHYGYNIGRSFIFNYIFTVDQASDSIIKDANKVKDSLLYCNVDSLYLERNNKKQLKDKIGSELGMYKIEGFIKYFKVLGIGKYIVNDKIKCIGINNTNKLSREDFKAGNKVMTTMWLKDKETNLYKNIDVERTL